MSYTPSQVALQQTAGLAPVRASATSRAIQLGLHPSPASPRQHAQGGSLTFDALWRVTF